MHIEENQHAAGFLKVCYFLAKVPQSVSDVLLASLGRTSIRSAVHWSPFI